MAPILFSGFILGILSSLHCVGMCGPLMLTLPLHRHEPAGRMPALLFYNLGRTITYSLLGLIVGLIGRPVFMAGLQQWFSITLGALILLACIQYYFKKRQIQPSFLKIFYTRLQLTMLKFIRPGYGASFLLGMANGLLPCGMVYLAIAGAMTASNIQASVAFMMAFGIGTMPLMLALGYWGTRFPVTAGIQVKRIMPWLVMGTGVLLILRGLNLGIPFVSPVISAPEGDAIRCP